MIWVEATWVRSIIWTFPPTRGEKAALIRRNQIHIMTDAWCVVIRKPRNGFKVKEFYKKYPSVRSQISFLHITDLPMLTVLPWGSRFSTKSPGLTGAFENLTVFPVVLTVKNFNCLAYHFDYGRLDFVRRDFPYVNKHSETPIDSGYTIIVTEIVRTLKVTILSPLYLFWWKKIIGIFFECKQIWRKDQARRSPEIIIKRNIILFGQKTIPLEQ